MEKCEEFHNLENQFQIDSLIDFPPEESENDPQDNEKEISDQ